MNIEAEPIADSVTITFLPGGINIHGRVGDTVLDAALDNGLDLPHECGGNCACTTCHIRVDSGAGNLSGMEWVEDDRLATAGNRTRHSRLACQALLNGGPVAITPLETW
jgi:ferredoxin